MGCAGPRRETKKARRDIARALDLRDLTLAPERFMGLLERLWDLGSPFGQLMFGSSSLREQVRRHVLRNPDWSAVLAERAAAHVRPDHLDAAIYLLVMLRTVGAGGQASLLVGRLSAPASTSATGRRCPVDPRPRQVSGGAGRGWCRPSAPVRLFACDSNVGGDRHDCGMSKSQAAGVGTGPAPGGQILTGAPLTCFGSLACRDE